MSSLDVLLADRKVGVLVNLPNDANTFVFDDAYLADPNRPVLSQHYLNDDGTMTDAGTKAVQRLAPPFFSNLLPEGALRRIVAQRLGVSEERDFPLLTHLGERLIGATRLRSSVAAPAVEPPEILALAIPGVQLKLSIVCDNDKITLPCTGEEGHFIAKVSTGALSGIIENEYSMLTFARMVGIPIPEIRLVDWEQIDIPGTLFKAQGPVLLVQRFDRSEAGRIHSEDFNQVFGQFPGAKYNNQTYSDIARILYRRVSVADTAEFIGRVVFCAAIANGDAHLKNWSLVYKDPTRPTLSPAYDLLTTLPYPSDSNLALSFGGAKDANILNAERQKIFAEKADIPQAFVRKAVNGMAERIRAAWPHFEGPMRDADRALVDRHLAEFFSQRVPNLRKPAVRLG